MPMLRAVLLLLVLLPCNRHRSEPAAVGGAAHRMDGGVDAAAPNDGRVIYDNHCDDNPLQPHCS